MSRVLVRCYRITRRYEYEQVCVARRGRRFLLVYAAAGSMLYQAMEKLYRSTLLTASHSQNLITLSLRVEKLVWTMYTGRLTKSFEGSGAGGGFTAL